MTSPPLPTIHARVAATLARLDEMVCRSATDTDDDTPQFLTGVAGPMQQHLSADEYAATLHPTAASLERELNTVKHRLTRLCKEAETIQYTAAEHERIVDELTRCHQLLGELQSQVNESSAA